MSTTFGSGRGNKSDMAGNAFVMPNPEEYYPSVSEFFGTPSNSSRRMSASLKGSVRQNSMEVSTTPVTFLGTFPVMANDRNVIGWDNACLQNQ
jgi:hypothetical protein